MVLIGFIGWLALVYGIVAIVLKAMKKNVLPGQFIALIAGVLLISISSIITKVGPQSVGVVVTPRGVDEAPIHTGWHIVMPWNDVHIMDKTVWVYTCANAPKEGQKPDADAIWSPTKDGIKMGFDVSVSWKIIANDAPWIYQNVTENDGGRSGRYLWLEDNVIRAKLKSALALTVSNFTPIEAYSNRRLEIQDQTLERIAEECKQYHLQIDNVDIREVYYNHDYETAINNKKLAEQEALRLVEVTKQKNELLKQSEIDKNIAIQKAEGEAKALQIKGTSIAKNPKIIQLEWINKWNGKLPNYMMGDGKGVILNLPQDK